jgi:hypothetical protein
VERNFKVGICAGCLFISRMIGRKDIVKPERLWMNDREAEVNKEVKGNFRCRNCSFWFIKELRDGKTSVFVENPEALDRLEEGLRKYFSQ